MPGRAPTASVQRPTSNIQSLKPEVRNSKGVEKERWEAGGRIRNTEESLAGLIRNPKAVLLENAWVDTSKPLELGIPAGLRAGTNAGVYLVQSEGVPDAVFRKAIRGAGGKLVAYIPNNAYLVQVTDAVKWAGNGGAGFGAVLAYEPYYKLKGAVLEEALEETSNFKLQTSNGRTEETSNFKLQTSNGRTEEGPSSEPQPSTFNLQLSRDYQVLLFAEGEEGTKGALAGMGVEVVGGEGSPFGPVLRVRAGAGHLAEMARLPGVQEIEARGRRYAASDLSRATMGVAADSVTNGNYLGLTGAGVLIAVSDTGVDANHPDLAGRVWCDMPSSGTDTNGHGTHVAGIIAGDGSESLTVTNAAGSVLPAVAGQFRGQAPGAKIFAMAVGLETGATNSDVYLQQTAARTNVFISNNSWLYAGDTDYDLAAASYDGAVRDALPGVSGGQPLLFVFSAGNGGAGSDDGTGGLPGTVESPGTAKNVVTVGALEQRRMITNVVWQCSDGGTNGPLVCQTNAMWLGMTDLSNQVASYSSRGNVGAGVEGTAGRFKPDVAAPGTFVVAARSGEWNQAAYYASTNGSGDAGQVLSNLNNGLGVYYRYESGTSLAAAEVAGTLGLMEEFFERRLGRTNSPALMKALLINGARAAGGLAGLGASAVTNGQGWGLVNLPNSVPGALSNLDSAAALPMWLFDQDTNGALATGQSRTRFVSVAAGARSAPLRATLVWTDPPGNPVAGLKLVNDLDLVVTNLDTGDVFWGNDIPAGTNFNQAWAPNTTPNADMVNNVENVFLAPPLGANYSVTVCARHVAVNAVTGTPDAVAQDYALVLSAGDGQVADALTVTDGPEDFAVTPNVTVVTNEFLLDPLDSGAVLLGQRAGASSPVLNSETVQLSGGPDSFLTMGDTNQWHFYVVTNDNGYTNAAFLTFEPRYLTTGETNLAGQALPGAQCTE